MVSKRDSAAALLQRKARVGKRLFILLRQPVPSPAQCSEPGVDVRFAVRGLGGERIVRELKVMKSLAHSVPGDHFKVTAVLKEDSAT
jgi:hypothetical protein